MAEEGIDVSTEVATPQKKEPLIRTRNIDDLVFFGQDSSLEILPHMGLSWEVLRSAGKPIGDLGAAYSTLAVEGYLRDIEVVPVDVMWDEYSKQYGGMVSERMYKADLTQTYLGDTYRHIQPAVQLPRGYFTMMDEGIKAASAKYLRADIAHIPVADRHFGITLLHDSVPKHAASLEEFLQEQLPEVLRVTDAKAFFYPMGIYQTIYYHKEYDDEEDDIVWREVPNPGTWNMKENSQFYQAEFQQKTPLYGYQNPQVVAQVAEVAKAHGFEYTIAYGQYYDTFNQKMQPEKTPTGVFTRID